MRAGIIHHCSLLLDAVTAPSPPRCVAEVLKYAVEASIFTLQTGLELSHNLSLFKDNMALLHQHLS